MDIDFAYDAMQNAYETTKGATPGESVTEVTALGIGLSAGYIGGLGAELTSDREAGDFDTEETLEAAGRGLFTGLVGGGTVGLVHELTDDVAEYGYEVAPSEAAAAGAGVGVGAAAGGSTVEGFRRFGEKVDGLWEKLRRN
jgi:hypothetical protein